MGLHNIDAFTHLALGHATTLKVIDAHVLIRKSFDVDSFNACGAFFVRKGHLLKICQGNGKAAHAIGGGQRAITKTNTRSCGVNALGGAISEREQKILVIGCSHAYGEYAQQSKN